jgi:hypothetical protein
MPLVCDRDLASGYFPRSCWRREYGGCVARPGVDRYCVAWRADGQRRFKQQSSTCEHAVHGNHDHSADNGDNDALDIDTSHIGNLQDRASEETPDHGADDAEDDRRDDSRHAARSVRKARTDRRWSANRALAPAYASLGVWDWWAFAWFGVIFIVGYLMYSDDRLVAAARDVLPALVVGILGSAALSAMDFAHWAAEPQIYGGTYVLMLTLYGITGWAWTLTLFGVGMRVSLMQRPLPARASEAV